MPETGRARLLANPKLGPAVLERLRAARVAVVGAGTLGWPAAQHLALLHVSLVFVDPGRVRPENLAAQLFPTGALGRAKAEVRAEQARELGAEGALEARCARAEDLGLGELADLDLVVAGLDSQRARVQLDSICQRLGIPLVDLATEASGERCFARISSHDPRAGDAACFSCRFDRPALEAIRREDQPAGCPSWRAPATTAPPTLQTSALAAVVGGLAAGRAVRILLDPKGAHAGRVLFVDCDAPERLHHGLLARSPHCSHAPRLAPLRRARGATLDALRAQAAADLGAAPQRLELQRALVRGLRCGACGAERPLVRCAFAIADAELRCHCGPGAELAPIELSSALGAEELHALAALPLRDLGVPRRDVVSLRAGDALAHYVLEEV